MTESKWKWIEGKADIKKEHFKLVYGDTDEFDSKPFIPAALISLNEPYEIVVEFTIPENIEPTFRQKIYEEVVRDIETILKLDCEPCNGNWNYMKYHCGTSANVYSDVHWGLFLAEDKRNLHHK